MSNSDNPDSFAGNMKRCSKCKIDKSRSSFSKRVASKDGLAYCCKVCALKYYQSPEGKASDKRHKQSDKGKEGKKKTRDKYNLTYPEKHVAVRTLNNAIVAGEIIRPDFCEFCFQEKRVEGHHPDYDKPLEVDWLCPECHRKLHKEILLV